MLSPLSDKAKTYLASIQEKVSPINKPSWDEYFIQIATLASTRSSDAETQHGCVITDKQHRVLGIGYNSFPVGMPDDILPNMRPQKYKWMVHAERNALANCTLRPENGIAYITGPPCLDCAKSLYQEGIRHFVCLDGHGTYLMDEEDEFVFEVFTKTGNIKVDWLQT
jgi:dCMP deaminase